VNYFLYLHGHCTHAPSHSGHPVLGGELIFLQVFSNRPVWIYFGLLVELWVGVSNFICHWMHTLYYFIMFVWLYTLIHIIYTYTHYIHLYTLCRVWNFWLIFKQNKFLYVGYGVCHIFWIEWNLCLMFINLRFFLILTWNISYCETEVTVLHFFSLHFTSTLCSVSLPPKWQFQLSYHLDCDSYSASVVHMTSTPVPICISLWITRV